MENIAALLEELGLSNKAVYLPSSMRIGNAQALIPLSGDIGYRRIKEQNTPEIDCPVGDNPGDMAIAITAPGGTGLNKLEIKPGPTSSEIEQAAAYVLTGLLDLADSIEVHFNDKQVNIEVIGLNYIMKTSGIIAASAVRLRLLSPLLPVMVLETGLESRKKTTGKGKVLFGLRYFLENI